jgi:hypothetical protein
MSGVSSDFKQSFGRLLVALSMTFTLEGKLQYSNTLITFTKAGLIADGKYGDKYKPVFIKAIKSYKSALEYFKVEGRPGYAKEMIYKYCFDIEFYLLPLALSEGLLEISEDAFNLTQSFNASAAAE